jgi:hypothetical protein
MSHLKDVLFIAAFLLAVGAGVYWPEPFPHRGKLIALALACFFATFVFFK